MLPLNGRPPVDGILMTTVWLLVPVMVKVVPAAKLGAILAVNTSLPLESKIPLEALTDPPAANSAAPRTRRLNSARAH